MSAKGARGQRRKATDEWLDALAESPLRQHLYVAHCLAAHFVSGDTFLKTGELEVWPCHATVAEKVGVHQDTVKQIFRKLRAAGWLTKVSVEKKGNRRYRLTIPQEAFVLKEGVERPSLGGSSGPPGGVERPHASGVERSPDSGEWTEGNDLGDVTLHHLPGGGNSGCHAHARARGAAAHDPQVTRDPAPRRWGVQPDGTDVNPFDEPGDPPLSRGSFTACIEDGDPDEEIEF